jgi:hypothetical protein
MKPMDLETERHCEGILTTMVIPTSSSCCAARVARYRITKNPTSIGAVDETATRTDTQQIAVYQKVNGVD